MKTKHRVISMILSIVMILGMLPMSVFAADEANGLDNFVKRNRFTAHTFEDVGKDDWFFANVKSAYQLGLMVGNSETTFNPEGNVTLAETITIAARLNSIYYTGSDKFAASEPWYQTYVDYAENNGIIDEAYDYTEAASRADFAVILAAALPEKALVEINRVADDAIPDVSTDDTYGEAVYKLYRAGIVTGNDEEGTFAPESSIRRCEVAAIVSRMADESLRRSIELGEEYTVTFDLNYAGADEDTQAVFEGDCASEPKEAPRRSGYTFDGWFTKADGGKKFEFDTPIHEDITLYAHWSKNNSGDDIIWYPPVWDGSYSDTYYTVTFDANGSDVENLPAPQRVKAGEFVLNLSEPVREGYIFAGWYLDEVGLIVWDNTKPISKDITVYATWYFAGVNQDDLSDEYRITNIVVDKDESIVNVEVTTAEECYLQLVVTDDLQSKIVYDKQVKVSASLRYETVEVNTGTLPDYFYIYAFLKDKDGNELCEGYSSSLYSKNFEEFYEKTVNDFDADRVINFDENTTTNFAVTQDDVIICEIPNNSISQVDNVLTVSGENIPKFYIRQKYVVYDGNSIYLVEPISVDQNGEDVIIISDDLPLIDYLEHIKIEEASYAFNASEPSELPGEISTFSRIDIIDIPGGENKQTISAGFTVSNDEEDAKIELLANGYIKNIFRLYLKADISWSGIKPIFI